MVLRTALPAVFGTLLVLIIPAVARGDDNEARERRRTPIVRVVEQCRDAVVNISTTQVVRVPRPVSIFQEFMDGDSTPYVERRASSIGSGFIVHESGYVVTNAHVVQRASDVKVVFSDEHSESAHIVAVDVEHDLAVLKIDSSQTFPAITLGHSDDLMIGETVVAIGNPFGLQHTVTSGIVSALNRRLAFSREVVYTGLIQTDAAINPGNSGGPLLNINGEVIGVNSAIRGDAQNVCFAIPVDRVWELLPQMLDIERQERVRFGLEVKGRAAEVTAVRDDSPAEKAGLRRGDRITEIDGRPLRNGIDYYVRLRGHHPGEPVKVKYERGGRSESATIKLESIPIPDGRKLAEERLGMVIGDIPSSLRQRFDLPESFGLMISGVARGGPADQAELSTGDVLTRIGRMPVTNLSDLGLALESVNRGEQVLIEGLTFRRDGIYSWTARPRAQ